MIGSVHLSVAHLSSVSTKIARSEDSGILAVVKRDDIVKCGEILSFFCFLTVDTHHEYYKSCDYVGHAYRSHLAHSTVHAQAQCHQVVKCMSDVQSAWGMCSREHAKAL